MLESVLYGLSSRHRHFHSALPRIFDLLEPRHVPVARGRDHLEIGPEGSCGEVESHLIVTLASAAMRDARRALDVGDLDEFLRDERPAERRRQRIPIFVQRVGLQRRQDVATRKLFAQIEHVRAHGARCQRAVAHRLELLPLSEIHRHGDDVRPVPFPEPGNRHRRVEPAGVRQDDAFHQSSSTIHREPRRREAHETPRAARVRKGRSCLKRTSCASRLRGERRITAPHTSPDV